MWGHIFIIYACRPTKGMLDFVLSEIKGFKCFKFKPKTAGSAHNVSRTGP